MIKIFFNTKIILILKKVSTLFECGSDLSNTCGSYLKINQSFAIKSNVTPLTYFTVKVGYNKILLDQLVKIKRGAIVWIDLNATLALDTSGNATYTDYQISSNSLLPLNSTNIRRFYFNCLIDKPFYISSIRIDYQYSASNIYNVSAYLTSSSVSVYSLVSIYISMKH